MRRNNVHAPKTAELIAANLRGRIVRGELKPGDALPREEALLAQFDVSRPTLREAYRILESETLLVVKRGARGGPRVTQPDRSVISRSVGLSLQLAGTTVKDVFRSRSVLEGYCVRLMAENPDYAPVATLRLIAEDIRAVRSAASPGDEVTREWMELIEEFHRTITAGSDNQALALLGGILADVEQAHYQVRTLTAAHRLDGRSIPDDRLDNVAPSYERLADLIEAGEADAAEQFWRGYMRDTLEIYYPSELSDQPIVDLVGLTS